MQASVDLHSTKTKTCAHAKKSRNHTEARKWMNLWLLSLLTLSRTPEYINQVARPSKDPISNKRIEAGLHCKRQTLPR